MRRLLLLALLLVPTVARADEFPTFYFSGCSSLELGCVTGTLAPGTGIYVGGYQMTFACEKCVFAYASAVIYNPQGDYIAVLGSGNPAKGLPSGAAPAFAITDLHGWYVPATGLSGPPIMVPLVLTTTPEPVSMALVGTGLLMLGVVRRRTRT